MSVCLCVSFAMWHVFQFAQNITGLFSLISANTTTRKTYWDNTRKSFANIQRTVRRVRVHKRTYATHSHEFRERRVYWWATASVYELNNSACVYKRRKVHPLSRLIIICKCVVWILLFECLDVVCRRGKMYSPVQWMRWRWNCALKAFVPELLIRSTHNSFHRSCLRTRMQMIAVMWKASLLDAHKQMSKIFWILFFFFFRTNVRR